MKMKFEGDLTQVEIIKYTKKKGWDDCLAENGGEVTYTTVSDSAALTLYADGSGTYEGQRSLLFSHAVFAMLTKAFVDGRLTAKVTYSQEPDIPAFLYFGNCYMHDLRLAAIKKILPEDKCDEKSLEWVESIYDSFRLLRNEIGFTWEIEKEIWREITNSLKWQWRHTLTAEIVPANEILPERHWLLQGSSGFLKKIDSFLLKA